MADITLYPGNSSGTLADCLGRVVGINTMIVNNLAVAVPSKIVNRFLSGNQRPQLGVSLQPVLLGRRTLGLLVLSVLSDSAAEVAGLQVGDVLVGVSGRLFTQPDDLARYLHSNADKSIALQVIRGKRQFVVDVLLQTGKPGVEAR